LFHGAVWIYHAPNSTSELRSWDGSGKRVAQMGDWGMDGYVVGINERSKINSPCDEDGEIIVYDDYGGSEQGVRCSGTTLADLMGSFSGAPAAGASAAGTISSETEVAGDGVAIAAIVDAGETSQAAALDGSSVPVATTAVHATTADSASNAITCGTAATALDVAGVPAEFVAQLYRYGDSDGNGTLNSDSTEGLADLDGDGMANFIDPDNDGDGVSDATETAQGTDPNAVAPTPVHGSLEPGSEG
jgi:hypothetical protein